jgi:hypothetical protein
MLLGAQVEQKMQILTNFIGSGCCQFCLDMGAIISRRYFPFPPWIGTLELCLNLPPRWILEMPRPVHCCFSHRPLTHQVKGIRRPDLRHRAHVP